MICVTMGVVRFLQRAKNSFLLFAISTMFPHCVTSRDTGHPQGWKWVSLGCPIGCVSTEHSIKGKGHSQAIHVSPDLRCCCQNTEDNG